MAELLQQRQVQRTIERSLENFRKIGKARLTPATVRSRITSLKDAWHQFQSGHAVLLKLIPEENQASIEYFRDNAFDATEEAYLTTMDTMSERLEELEPPVSPIRIGDASHLLQSTGSQIARPSAFSSVHLPPIRLPPFDGTCGEWEPFRDRFTALIIHNSDLNEFSRMHFLHSSLKGRALETIAHLPITADNFSVAWEALSARYENQRRLIRFHLSNILDAESLTRESACELQSLCNKIKTSLSALANLRRSDTDLWNDLLVHIVTEKLDSSTRKAWNLKTSDNQEPLAFDDLAAFMAARARALEEYSSGAGNKSSGKPAIHARVHVANSSAPSAAACPLCKARHYFSACPRFIRASPSQRRDLVKSHKRCLNCLSKNHTASECQSKYSCRDCHQRHHSMLHAGSDSRAAQLAVAAPTDRAPQPYEADSAVTSLFASTTRQRTQVLLATAWVKLRSSAGRTVNIRALIDQGSEMTFISENVAQLLRSKRVRMPVSVSTVGGVHAGTFKHATRIFVSPLNDLSPSLATTALIMPHLTAYAPKCVVNIANFSHLKDIPLADPEPAGSAPIQIIIGADLYSEIILTGLRRGSVGQPIAQRTIFGWIVSGPIGSDYHPAHGSSRDAFTPRLSVNVAAHHCTLASSLEEELKRFWELEELPRHSSVTDADAQCERHFQATHSRSSDGRYIVRLPLKSDPPIEIGESRTRAAKVLASLSRRLRNLPTQAVEYVKFLKEYERLGHMRRSPAVSSASKSRCVFIPHHPVFREDSATTHLRVVFNASSVTTNGTSLNDHVLTGPKLQTEIASVILQWRQFRFVYSADIAKMYRQIRVDERDLNYQRILWSESLNESAHEYQLLTVTYGMSCAPFLALRVLQQLAADEGADFPRAVPILRDHTYVDDILFGGDDIPIMRETRDQLVNLLRRGGFHLRKWASNSPVLLEDIDATDHGLAMPKPLALDEKLKILGLGWNPARDAFQFTVCLADSVPSTKRTILSAIAKLYDPLGWVAPVIITAKILMQHLWKEQVGWDEPVSELLYARWNRIYVRLSHLNGLTIARWTGFEADAGIELHGFCDASNVAYAAAVYQRVTLSSGQVIVTLLTGKSRVAPLNPLSIPRLELAAAVLLARLFEFVRGSRGLSDAPCVCWTDSQIVLAWLKQHPTRWKTFVANRVAFIQTHLPNVSWRYVPTAHNPADCASRGLLGDELGDHTLWWRGPPWLCDSSSDWPPDQACLPEAAPLEEKIASCLCTTPQEPFEIASRFSSWPKLLRVTAYLLRFINRCRRDPIYIERIAVHGRALITAECEQARSFWIKQIQRAVFPKEIALLALKKSLSPKSAILSLGPFLDREGVLRVGGRINKAPVPYPTRHPIVLSSHPVVKLIVEHAHLRALHAGPQLTLSTLRRDFWVLRARGIVKAVIHQCVACTRERAAVPAQFMSGLPAVRISAPPRSFLHCGVDYAGPIHVRASAGRGITSRKAYVALFVCLSTRAIHLELVSDYSTQAFLSAYARFCSRRGLPQAFYSDNGTNFVGAATELNVAYNAAVRDPHFRNVIATDRVTWHFVPPAAPHFGGLWEAGVRSVKHHLRRILGAHTLTFEELATVLCKIEACLNSRPIAPLSDSLEDYEPLTPGHFLIGSALTASPEPSLLDVKENRLTRWQLVRQITERFWKVWQTDYINTLQQRAKWRKIKPCIKVGQLIFLRNPTLPPCKWELGRVTECFPGSDGLIRVVKIRTARAEYKRPIVQLCLLPIHCDTPTAPAVSLCTET